jgi:hypothetical protein
MSEIQTERMNADTMAKILCRLESRRTGRSIDEVVAPRVELWMRHRYEAEQLLEELSDWGYPTIRTTPTPERPVGAESEQER